MSDPRLAQKNPLNQTLAKEVKKARKSEIGLEKESEKELERENAC